jgi:hypothetical protein
MIIVFIIVRRPRDVATDYYSGHIIVQAPFDSALLSSSSALAENYEKEFCSLVSSKMCNNNIFNLIHNSFLLLIIEDFSLLF